MNVSFSLLLCLALMMSSCCGSHEEELTTEFDDYLSEATTPDYDYNTTFDYYYVTGMYSSEVKNKAAGIGPLSLVLLLGLAVHQI